MNLLQNSNDTAIVLKELRISYEMLLRHIGFYSTLFRSGNTKKVAIFSENRPEWAYAFYAAWKNQSTVVPIDFMSPADDVAYILNDCQPEIIFCSREMAEVCEEALKFLATLFPDREIVGIRMRAGPMQGGAIHCMTQQVTAVSANEKSV